MKKILLVLLLIGSTIQLKAQSFEISAQVNTGLSHYTGSGTTGSTNLNVDEQSHTGYPNNDGNRSYATFGADVQFQYTFKSNFLLGGQIGYDALGSKVNIDHIYTTEGEVGANGSFTAHLDYFNINPYIGYRVKFSKVYIDIMPGLDIALGVGGKLKGSATTDNVVYTATTNSFGKPKDDVRARFGLAAYYKKFGFTASYARGLVNFNSGELADGPVPALHLEVVRIGVSYQIK